MRRRLKGERSVVARSKQPKSHCKNIRRRLSKETTLYYLKPVAKLNGSVFTLIIPT